MENDAHLPIALRRSKRVSLGQQQRAPSNSEDPISAPAPTPSRSSTPTRQSQPRKRVRFSDPGPATNSLEDELSIEVSTGLTPFIRRASLSGRSKRRYSTPARRPPKRDAETPSSPINELRFLPLRQVLDGRIQRRIRRNGLSEEMNTITAERRRRAREGKAEIERLKAEVAAKDEEIRKLHDETLVLDTDRVWDLEQQVEALKKELSNRSGVQPSIPSSPSYDWTMAARDPYSDPYSDDFMDVDTGNDGGGGGDDEEEFGETTMADLASSTPTRRARVSFLTPPTTSPAAAKPMTPSSQQTTRQATHQATPCSDMGVQAALPDPEKQRLEDELASLQLEICKLTTTLESCSALESRLSAKLATAQGHSSDSSPDIEARLGAILQTLSDRTAALMDLNTSLKNLGFPGSDASEVITSLSTALRNARLELEYMTPGEIDLPLTTAGGAVLNMILDRLRTLSKKHREAEDSIDEYHSIEQSLRQQLGARVEAMDGMSKELGRMEGEVREKDERIAELEVGLERLKGAVQKYTRDISELESLVQRMEAELEASAAARRLDQAIQEQLAEQHAAELSQKASAISDLDAKLSAAVARTESLQGELATMQTAHAKALDDLRSENKTELANVVKSHGQALASRDARVAELRVEIDRVNASLRAAHETVRRLRVENGQLKELNDELASENGGLETTLEFDRQKATEVIISMKTELERVLHMGEGFLSTPKKAKVTPGGSKRDSGFGVGADEEVTSLSSPPTSTDPNSGPLLGGDLVRKPTGKKRRRYDSGLGFPDEDEINVDA